MNNSIDLSVLVQRMEKLEQQNRLFKIAAILALLVIASLFLIAARPLDVQTA